MKHIAKVIPGENFTLVLLFESGEVRLVDMKPVIRGEGVWSELRDPDMFATVRVQEKFGGLEWANGLSYCPDSAFIDSDEPPLWLLQELFDVYSDKKKDEAQRKVG
ncbi:MAG: DUF2442 domain-containing protein [Pseudomonadota bacterium]